MNKAIKHAILHEAAKIYSPTPEIISEETPVGKCFALAFVADGYKEILTAWHSTPGRIIDAIRVQIRYREEMDRIYPNQGTETSYELAATNID